MKKFSTVLALISFLFILIYSCSKEDQTFSGSSGNTVRTTISGMVLDENNTAVANVNITAYSQTTTTNQYGVFVLKDISVNKERCIVQFSKAGYFNRAHAFIASANTVNYVRVVLISNAQTHTVDAATGGTAALANGSSVQFAPNSFVTTTGSAYTGTVSLTVKHLSPDAANFGFMIPGGDLAGENINGEDVILYPYGMMGVELKGSSGEALQLAAGTTATLTMPIVASQQATAPATIPLWYFDEETSLWKEEGAATRVGNNYTGTVSHFTWWNCDGWTVNPLIKGKVVDCNGVPVPNCVVTINGWATTLTNQNGEYQGLVPGALAFTVQVLASNNSWLIFNSQIENVPPLSANQIFIVPDLVIPCPTRVVGTLRTCAGENTDGIVIISSTGFSNYQYTQDGSFNLISIPNTQLGLSALNSNSSIQQIITSLSAPNILNLGNLFLCDEAANSFIINGCGFNYQLFNFDSIGFTGSANSNLITMSGTAPPDYTISAFQMYLNANLNVGSYLWSNSASPLSITVQNTSQTFYITGSQAGGGITNITQYDSVGGRVKGYYSGSGWVSNCLFDTITITGSFDVLRTQ
ncbi:MAG: carboxypeptidase-like regulatory domain-containing protein [Bacteroidia bacterium]